MKKNSLKKIYDYARTSFRDKISRKKDQLHCGIRFYSDILLDEKIKNGLTIDQALKELASEDFKEL